MFPTDYEKFKMLCENAKMNRNYRELKLICYCCKKQDHTLKDCPKIHFVPNIELSILKVFYQFNNKFI